MEDEEGEISFKNTEIITKFGKDVSDFRKLKTFQSENFLPFFFSIKKAAKCKDRKGKNKDPSNENTTTENFNLISQHHRRS